MRPQSTMEKELANRKYRKNNVPGPNSYDNRATYYKSSTTLKTIETKFTKSERRTFSVEYANSKKSIPAVGTYKPNENFAYKPMRKY